jgi:hypothetical protein
VRRLLVLLVAAVLRPLLLALAEVVAALLLLLLLLGLVALVVVVAMGVARLVLCWLVLVGCGQAGWGEGVASRGSSRWHWARRCGAGAEAWPWQ